MHQNKKITAVFIAYRAVTTLEEFYNAFPKELFDEIILVDDQSGDGTFELAKNLGIQSYQTETNLGYGGNLKKTLCLALDHGADVIVDLHPDGEYKPSAILPALQEINNGAEFILGNRFQDINKTLKSGMYFWKILPILLLNWVDKTILSLPINDVHQGFRVYTRSMLEKIDFLNNSNDYLFSFELIAQAAFKKCKFAQVPVETSYTGGKRGASLKNSIKYSLKTFKVLILFMLAKMGIRIALFRNPSRR